MRYQLNIGLLIAHGDNSEPAIRRRGDFAASCLHGARKAESRYMHDGVEVVEPVIVGWIELPEGGARLWISLLAVALGQDCIAAWCDDNEVGELVGPKAADWGAFRPDDFIWF